MMKAFRPRIAFYRVLGSLIEDDEFLILSEDQFVARVMTLTHGSANPEEARKIFRELREEAI